MLLSRKLLPGEIEHVENMVIVLHLAGYNKTQIGQTIGLSHTQVIQLLDQPHVAEALVEIRAALPKAALDLLQGYMIEAVQTIVDIMRTETDNKIVLQAASEILDRSGLAKASRQERHQINENRTVFSDDGIVEKLRKASPEVQEQAAQAIEALESSAHRCREDRCGQRRKSRNEQREQRHRERQGSSSVMVGGKILKSTDYGGSEWADETGGSSGPISDGQLPARIRAQADGNPCMDANNGELPAGGA